MMLVFWLHYGFVGAQVGIFQNGKIRAMETIRIDGVMKGSYKIQEYEEYALYQSSLLMKEIGKPKNQVYTQMILNDPRITLRIMDPEYGSQKYLKYFTGKAVEEVIPLIVKYVDLCQEIAILDELAEYQG